MTLSLAEYAAQPDRGKPTSTWESVPERDEIVEGYIAGIDPGKIFHWLQSDCGYGTEEKPLPAGYEALRRWLKTHYSVARQLPASERRS